MLPCMPRRRRAETNPCQLVRYYRSALPSNLVNGRTLGQPTRWLRATNTSGVVLLVERAKDLRYQLKPRIIGISGTTMRITDKVQFTNTHSNVGGRLSADKGNIEPHERRFKYLSPIVVTQFMCIYFLTRGSHPKERDHMSWWILRAQIDTATHSINRMV